MKAIRQVVGAATIAAVLLGIAFALFAFARSRPQDLPWTPLDLGETPGLFTGAKLAGLADDFPRCRALLDAAGVQYEELPARDGGEQCGYDDGIRLADGARRIGFSPRGLGTSCPVAAGLAMLEWHVIQPAAERHFGTRVSRIEHFGSYSCRRLYGRGTGDWSQHARANALDIAGFVLVDGRRVRVVTDWDDEAERGAFLREVRDGACGLFATVLSPDYNAAHRDHFHIDQANRGGMGWRACR